MDKDVRYWVDLSTYDTGTALAMYKTGRYIYVLFMCQQAAEKMLKALIVHRTKTFPPKVHDLERLAGVCRLELPTEHAELLRALTAYYIETRYPEDVKKIARDIDRAKARDYLTRTKSWLSWLRKQFV